MCSIRSSGQERAVAHLRAAVRSPVHAYLLVGPPGTGKRVGRPGLRRRPAVPTRGDAASATCAARALAEVHPDLVVVEREGAFLSIERAREIRRLAMRTPDRGRPQGAAAHRVPPGPGRGARLLKTIEEPPPSTVFVILADHVPPELVTIASRCVRIDFGPLGTALLAATLVAEGVAPDSPPTWPRPPAAGWTGPACWRRTRASPSGGRPGGRCRAASTAPARRWPSWPPSWSSCWRRPVPPRWRPATRPRRRRWRSG